MSREQQTSSKATDQAPVQKRIRELERQVADLEAGLDIQASGGEKALIAALSELRTRLEQVEKENHEFANMYVEIQEQNEALTNLYVASQRLHATFDLDQVKTIISEILAEMVGAEEFGLLVLDRERKNLHVLAGEGIRERLPKEALPVGEGIIGDVARTGESFYFVPKSEAEKKAHLPLATLPLKLNDQTVGVVVIYRLLSHKPTFSPIDHQILELVAGHAASALVSARLHGTMDRKLKTIEGFMQLMKSR
jgi:nitrate/nitrite-specific signal transduction histidine kinase